MTDQRAEPASTDENRPPKTDAAGAADSADTADTADSADSADTDSADTADTRPPARVGLLAIVAGLVLAADVATKVAAVAQLEGERPVRLLGGAAYLVLFRNSGAAFSMATGLTWLLTLIAIAVVIVIIRLAPKLRSPGWAIGLGLVLGGAAGNLVDRLFRAPGPLRGHVIDFFSVFAPDGSVFPVFNVADSAIVVGGLLLMLLAVLGHDYDGTRHRDREEPAG